MLAKVRNSLDVQRIRGVPHLHVHRGGLLVGVRVADQQHLKATQTTENHKGPGIRAGVSVGEDQNKLRENMAESLPCIVLKGAAPSIPATSIKTALVVTEMTTRKYAHRCAMCQALSDLVSTLS